ncbi:chitin binding peritrophin-A domain-containing protein [Algicola sagamiensis]|uniref:chitin binding peritrophin-A domain-containing protein n=1 Tax=Algicola sagamiensis TaxID=163869 RepID=UPI00036F71CB|nr:chitin binding peritrophin-A domain-containing protein [Algicola sagamiensis]
MTVMNFLTKTLRQAFFCMMAFFSTIAFAEQACIEQCDSRQDGTYASCQSDEAFVTCTGGISFESMCPTGLVWLSEHNRCGVMDDAVMDSPVISDLSILEVESESSCVTSCDGKADGNYQSCQNCNQYVACISGRLYQMVCPNGYEWDDDMKSCTTASLTCN